jgi:4-hydroxythreonine-4-phosphate dehydrogenase
MLEILVVADDLTGAADCAAACAAHGLDAIVLRGLETEPPAGQVLAIDAATRRLTPEAAAARTASLVAAHARRARPRALYKKMDSTLRGHVGVELAAALGVWRDLDPAQRTAVAILAPAFPATGRTTFGGRQRVNGAVLPQDLAAMVQAGGLRTALVGRGRLSAGAAVTVEMRDADVWICDAETEEDLRTIAAAAASRGRNAVWAGSGGFARPMPEALGLERRPPVVTAIPAAGPILFVVGSLSGVSLEQVESLGAQPGVFTTVIRRETLAAGAQSPGWSRSTLCLRAALDAGHDAVLSLAPCDPNEAEDPSVATALARFAAPHAVRSGGLVLTGGDTARAVIEALGIAYLRIVGEVEPGVPRCIAGPLARPIITKAGAFGDPDTLRRCRAAMKASS